MYKIVFISLLLITCTGAADPPATASSQKYQGKEAAGFRLTIASYGGNKQIPSTNIHIILQNIGPEDITLGSAPAFARFKIIVKTSDGIVAPETMFARRLIFVNSAHSLKGHWVLKAGDQIDAKFNVSRLFDMSLPCTYHIQVMAKVPSREPKHSIVLITSNVIELQVQSPDDDTWQSGGEKIQRALSNNQPEEDSEKPMDGGSQVRIKSPYHTPASQP